MAPVFSLVLDKDVNEDVALLYPELYKELTKASLVPNPPDASSVLLTFSPLTTGSITVL